MAVTVERVHLAMAHAALPGLLPTPPACKMAPLLLTPMCAVILPTSPPKPSRADADERWDARKKKKDTTLNKSPSKPTSRADAVDRWNARKFTAQNSIPESSSTRSSGHQSSFPDEGANKKSSSSSASSCARWDSNKKKKTSTSSSSSTSTSSWDSTKRPVISRGSSSSAERWDAHKKKPRPPQADVFDTDDGQSSTGSNDDKPQLTALYAGPGFLAPPEPSMLPVPSFLVLPRFVAA